MSNTWLVIPSCRMDNLRQFFDAWQGKGGWDKVVVIEDAPQKSDLLWLKSYMHYSHAEIKEVLGEDSWIISRRDSAIRCFGFLLAWWGGAERVLTLDDDVRPIDGTHDFVMDHRESMCHPQWVSSIFGLRVRGIPYKSLGALSDVVANVGVWEGHPDFDAICQLGLIANKSNPGCRYMPDANWIVPHGQFFPLCGMNYLIERKALPLAYFPLMGDGQPFARFDDIWHGIIFKHCCDALGWHVSVGKPFVRHDKASDPFVNLRKEAPGIGVNEQFWERIAAIDLREYESAVECMLVIGEIMQEWDGEYWIRLGEAMETWANTFRIKPTGLKL
jgi:reversibly glycosylated polypeptide / UDP-arabinopyranose mutase